MIKVLMNTSNHKVLFAML